jgi:hypothetical protein
MDPKKAIKNPATNAIKALHHDASHDGRVGIWHMAHVLKLEFMAVSDGTRLAIDRAMSFVRHGSWVVVVGMFACGGSVVTVDGGTGTDSGTDGAPVGWECPASPPTAPSACPHDTLKCEYGTNPDPSCNQQFLCTGGSWVNQTTGTFCPPQSDCPSTYAQVPANQDCTPNQLQCAYPEGECICTTSFGGLQKQTPAWNCIPKVTGCPSPRPDVGSSCAGSQHCDYGACSGGIAIDCVNGVWQQDEVLCPN